MTRSLDITDAFAQSHARVYVRGPRFCLGRADAYEVVSYALPLDPLEAPVRLVHLSDLHLRPGWYRGLDAVARHCAQARPDVICFTGDWVDDKFDPRPTLPVLSRFIRTLRHATPAPLVGVLGNHDGDLLARAIVDAGVTLLIDQTLRLGPIELLGLHGVSRDDRDEMPPVAPRPHDAVRVVLAHFPDTIVARHALDAHLLLAGHTHGGQLCLPGGTALITHDPLPRRYAQGLHRFGQTWLHVSRGLGTTFIHARTFCPPTITLFDLTPRALNRSDTDA